MIKLKAYFGIDEDGNGEGFYWPGSKGKRAEIKSVRLGSPGDFASTYQCRPGARTGSIFIEKDFTYYTPPEGLLNGMADPSVQEFCAKGYGVFQAWDTASEDTKESAYSVGVTGLFIPCKEYHRNEDPRIVGECDAHYDVAILDVFRKQMQWGDLGMAMREQRGRWQPMQTLVEKRQSGIAVYQSLKSAGVPIIGVEATEGKRARAVNGVGAGSAQGWFKLHRVLFPLPFEDGSIAPWLKEFITELKDFSGDESSFTDQVDAVVHLIRYAIMEGATTMLLPSDWSPERGTYTVDDAAMMIGGRAEQGAFLSMLGELPNMVQDPFEDTCQRCKSYDKGWCTMHRSKRTALDSCLMHDPRGHVHA